MASRSESEIVLNEISALQAIFCNNGEFLLHSPLNLERNDATHYFSLNLKCVSEDENLIENKSVSLKVTVSLPQGYPDVLPRVSLSSAQATRNTLNELHVRLNAFVSTLPEGPKVLQIATWLQEQRINNLKTDSTSTSSIKQQGKIGSDETQRTRLLVKLDHVRNRTRYLKTITQWVEELRIAGKMFFSGRLILLFVEGEAGSVSEYLHRHKTCKVDIDSAGKPCKERMMNIIIQEKSPGSR